MPAEENLKLFNVLSIGFGVGIFLKNKTSKIINLIRAVCVIVSSVYKTCLITTSLIFLGKKWFLIFSLVFIYYFTTIAYTIIINCNRKQLACLLKTFFKSLSHRESKMMKVTSVFMGIATLIHFFTYVLSYCFSPLCGPSLLEIFMCSLKTFQSDMFMHAVSFYLIIILSSFYCHRKTLHDIKNQCSRKDLTFPVKEACQRLMFIKKNMLCINSAFGPALGLMFLFILTCLPSYMFLTTTDEAKETWIFAEITTIWVNTVLCLVLVIVCENLQSRLEGIREEIVNQVIDRNTLTVSHHHCKIFLNLLQDQQLLTFTAMNMFSMSYGMVMCFSGTLISIGVLICQINSSMKENNPS